MLLIPKEKLNAVLAILADDSTQSNGPSQLAKENKKSLADDPLSKARELWPTALETLPMNDEHKEELKAHWGRLHEDFKIATAK